MLLLACKSAGRIDDGIRCVSQHCWSSKQQQDPIGCNVPIFIMPELVLKMHCDHAGKVYSAAICCTRHARNSWTVNASTGSPLLMPGSEVVFKSFDLLEYQIHTISSPEPASGVIIVGCGADGGALKHFQQGQPSNESSGDF